MTSRKEELAAEMTGANRPIRRRGVVAVVVRDGEFLVIRRAHCVAAPRAYCFPGGGIEGEESEEEALVREIREELGVEIIPRRRLWRSVTPWGVALAWWLGDIAPDATLVPDPSEVESVQWCAPEAMAQLSNLLESNHAFLRALSSGEIDLLV